jgi:hypothetical protein
MSRGRFHGSVVQLELRGEPAPAPPVSPSPGQLKLSPAALDYGTHPPANLLGANMPIITVTVINTGGQSVRLVSETSSNGIFSMPANPCSSASLAPGQSCGINLQYCPNAPGTSASTRSPSPGRPAPSPSPPPPMSLELRPRCSSQARWSCCRG